MGVSWGRDGGTGKEDDGEGKKKVGNSRRRGKGDGRVQT